MRIPKDAVIAPAKITEYLLVQRRKNDKSQFLAQVGFTRDDPESLTAAIRNLIAEHEGVFDRRNEYGTFYRVEGNLHGPDGSLRVITVWIQRQIDDVFWFVTLKPVR